VLLALVACHSEQILFRKHNIKERGKGETIVTSRRTELHEVACFCSLNAGTHQVVVPDMLPSASLGQVSSLRQVWVGFVRIL